MGNYPVEVIKTLQQVILETEGSSDILNPLPEVITKTAMQLVMRFVRLLKISSKVIMSMTHSGSTARMISRYRPNSSIMH